MYVWLRELQILRYSKICSGYTPINFRNDKTKYTW